MAVASTATQNLRSSAGPSVEEQTLKRYGIDAFLSDSEDGKKSYEARKSLFEIYYKNHAQHLKNRERSYSNFSLIFFFFFIFW